jgi:hypothetical protein
LKQNIVIMFSSIFLFPSSNASEFKLPEEIGRVESARDTNLLQLEPTSVNERYYTSGEAERHQKISPTLPAGAPIPDSDDVPSLKGQQQTASPEKLPQISIPVASATKISPSSDSKEKSKIQGLPAQSIQPDLSRH